MSPLIIALVGVGIFIGFIWFSSRNADPIDNRLLEAVRGDRALAKRLLAHAKYKYPGKSDRWYVEKVIYDLERDRAGSASRSSRFRMNSREVRENIFLIAAVVSLINFIGYSVRRWFRH